MRSTPWVAVQPNDTRSFGFHVALAGQLLNALHRDYGRGWHVWHDGRRLIVTVMDLRWMPRIYLRPLPNNRVGVSYPKLVSETDRQQWNLWLHALGINSRATAAARKAVERRPTRFVSESLVPLDDTQLSVNKVALFLRLIRTDRRYDVRRDPSDPPLVYHVIHQPPAPPDWREPYAYPFTIVGQVALQSLRPWINILKENPRYPTQRQYLRDTCRLYAHRRDFP